MAAGAPGQRTGVIFNSLQYFAFLPVVVATYWLVRGRARTVLLLAASYVFYGMWDWRFLGLIVISTVVDFSVGLGLARATAPKARRRLLGMSLTVNIGLLAIFKYLGFFVDSASDLLDSLGLPTSDVVLSVALPVGISFYTFQTLSYTIDIYRGRLAPVNDLVVFATFVAFFPQLVAGPIERAKRLLPQIENTSARFSADDFASGVGLIVLGLFQKVVIADLAAPIANESFSNPDGASAIALAVGVMAFSLQIYGDFAGYSNIARGSARLFGIELIHNFTEPYLSRNIAEFWQRWHISLSTWLRDYVYISLGGNRAGNLLTYRNLMLTMLLGGLWHGAGWNFVIWGGLHGIFLAVHRLAYGKRAPAEEVTWRDIPNMLLTFLAVTAAWIFFRADNASDAWAILIRIASLQDGTGFASKSVLTVVALFTATLAIDLSIRRRATAGVRIERKPVLAGLATGVFLLGVLVASGGEQVPFIYFQF